MSIADRMSVSEHLPMPKKPPMASGSGGEGNPIHEHLAKIHAESGGKHMHVSGSGDGGYTSHQIGDSGQPEGPHDHENLEALKDHIDKFFTEEEGESSDSDNHGKHGKDDEGLM